MTKKITYLSLFTAIAIILGYIESLIPFSFSIPGSKIGLANIINISYLSWWTQEHFKHFLEAFYDALGILTSSTGLLKKPG